MKNTKPQKIIEWENENFSEIDLHLIIEEPLSIRINGEPYSVVMRTPGEEIAHAAGFCLAEGIVDSQDDYKTIASCEDGDINVVTITLSESRKKKIPGILERKNFLSQTSCGICGKELIQDINQMLTPQEIIKTIDLKKAFDCLMSLPKIQPLRKKTRATHAAAIYNFEYELLAISEDAGRHNAVDKSIGKLFLEKKLGDAFFLLLSSRISFELVQKAARAKIQTIVAFSRPTELAIKVAETNNMTLISYSKKNGFHIFSGNNYK